LSDEQLTQADAGGISLQTVFEKEIEETKEHSDGGRCHNFMAQFGRTAGRAVIDGII
jgi:hypothetical protein